MRFTNFWSKKSDCVHIVNSDDIKLEIESSGLHTLRKEGLLNKNLITALVEFLRYLDDYQYNLCIQGNLVQDVKLQNVISQSRLLTLELITRAKAALYACISNPNIEQIQKRIESVLASLISDASTIGNELLPKLERDMKDTPMSNNSSYARKNVIESARAIGEVSSSLAKIFPEVNKGKKYFSGSIEIKLTQRSKKDLDVDLLSKEIKNIAGVVDMWFSDGKSFDMLAEIEVSDYDEALAIQSEMKSIPGIKSVEMLLESENSAF